MERRTFEQLGIDDVEDDMVDVVKSFAFPGLLASEDDSTV
jgi:hypothetical protein